MEFRYQQPCIYAHDYCGNRDYAASGDGKNKSWCFHAPMCVFAHARCAHRKAGFKPDEIHFVSCRGCGYNPRFVDIINPEGLAAPKGYNNGILCGNVLAVAGQVAWDKDRKIVGGDNFAKQFGQALRNVVSVVGEAGGEPADIMKLTIFVTDKTKYLSSLKEVGAEYRAVMGRHFPAMTLVEVKGLVEEGAMVEIEGLAYIGSRQKQGS